MTSKHPRRPSTCPWSTARARRRRGGSRGAVLVEALVVIVFFILAFASILYFHSMYRKTLHTTRLARAATLGYAMVGCRGDKSAGLSRELGAEHAVGGDVGSGRVPYAGQSATPSGSPEALRSLGANSDVQSSVGNDIARFGVSGSVSQNTADSAFTSDVTAYSYAACADKVRNETTSETSRNATNAISF